MKKTKILYTLIVSLFLAHSAYAEIVVNEIMPCNISSYMDTELYNFSPYLEFFNDGKTATDLKGYRIVHEKKTSKSVYELKWEWVLDQSVVVPANGYQLIFFDNKTNIGHAPYKLDTDGGKLYLYNADGQLCSSVTYPPMYAHVAYGDGGYMEPSPLKKNGLAVANLVSGRCKEPVFGGTTPGVQSAASKLTISTATEGATIYYTTDGTEPNTSSLVYSKAIDVKANTCIRARAYKDGMLSSSILTGSFLFLDEAHKGCGNGFTVPIVSLVVDKKYLDDDMIGIATVGKNGAPVVSSCQGSGKANFMQDWDRPLNFEYIVNGQQVLSHEVEAAVMGGCSRAHSVKSFKLKAGKKLGYGNEYLDYTFFEEKAGNKYKSLHIRNGGNAFEESNIRCRDGYMQSLAKVMNIDYQAYQPIAYFINGKYKGLMGLRERTNEDYVLSNYGIDGEDIDFVKITTNGGIEATNGDCNVYNQMVSFLETNDPASDGYYETAARYIDMNEYIDYNIFEQFIVNTDWPGNNCKLWREKANGPFRWIAYDTDFGLGLYGAYADNYCDVNLNMIEWCTGESTKLNWANGTASNNGFFGSSYVYDAASAYKTTIFRHLMQNETFRQKFLNRYLIHLGTTFTKTRVQAVWDSLANVVKDEYCATFSGADLKKQGESMVNFAKNRPANIYNHLKSYYGLDALVNLEFSSNIDNVHFMMNGEAVNLTSFSGKYFAGMPLKLEAVSSGDYKFSHWEMAGAGSDGSLLSENSSWTYYYKQVGFEDNSWTLPSFNDATWDKGNGRFGYSNSSSNYTTVLDYGPKADDKYVTAYFRSKFTVDDISNIKSLKYNVVYDDAYVLYINGKEVSRQNISGDVIYSTFADDYANDAEDEVTITGADLSKYLVEGENVIAVEVHQNVAGSSDLTFELAMNADYIEPVGEKLTDKVLSIMVNENQSIKAIFEKVTTCTEPTLLITEICSSNHSDSKVMDEYGSHPDWFEVYNYGMQTIDLAGMYFTNDDNEPNRSMVPFGYEETKIKPGEYKLFWADKKSYRGPFHLNFKLNNKEDLSSVSIYNQCQSDYSVVDMAGYSPMETNTSYGVEDVTANRWNLAWKVYGLDCEGGNLYLPTPKAENGSLFKECETTLTEENGVLADCVIYPNPAETVLNVLLNEAKHIELTIYDNMGREVMQQQYEGSEVELDVNFLSAGIYHIRIVSDSIIAQKSFLKR